MAAVLTPGFRAAEPNRLRLPDLRGAAGLIEEVRYGLGDTVLQGPVQLEAGDWWLRISDLKALAELLSGKGLELRGVTCRRPETLVAASALGLDAEPAEPASDVTTAGRPRSDAGAEGLRGSSGMSAGPAAHGPAPELLIHRGTLRSGDHLQSEGSLLLLGDVNPGARISAGGHVLVWGRLRGVAHAGRGGDMTATITALQLRPLQLRIAGAVARGPEEAPAAGQAEQARLVGGEIRIDPASPCWPLSD